MRLTRLLLRRHRLAIGSWLVLLLVVCAATVSAYQRTYATDAQRREAVRLAQHNAATTLLYGRLPDPGTAAQMYAWEIGAIVTILAAVMAVLIAVALTRVPEDDGTLELIRGYGTAPRQPLRSAVTILGAVAAVLAVGCAVAVGLGGRGVDGVTWPGAAVFGTTVALTFLFVATLTVVLAQIAPAAGQTRLLAFAAVGISFALRAIADTRHAGALNWFTPLGLRATARPFTADRWWGLLPAVAATVALTAVAVALAARREFGAGLIRRHDSRTNRLRLRTTAGLVARLTRSSVVAWTVGVALLGVLFSTAGSGVVQQSREGNLGGFLGSQLNGGDPAAGYLSYCGTVVGILVSCFAVLSVLTAQREESAGLTDIVLTTGVRRWVPLAARAAVTAAGCAVILAATALLSALIAPSVVSGDHVAARSLGYLLGQWPAAAAMAGCATLIVGLRPRLGWLAWLPLVASAFLALLGDLLRVPHAIERLGFFKHVPDIAGTHRSVAALLVLTAVALALSAGGVGGTLHRDITTG
jgi:ABC-2 type transport system permease protein